MRTLLHLSDVHFGPPHRPELAAGLLALIRERRPDLVVLSGDLTQRAKPAQFRAARAFVDAIPVPTLAVPGNHDVPMYRWGFLQRLAVPYTAYRRHFSPDMEPTFEDEELSVFGLNTAFNWTIRDGRITPAQLARTVARLAGAPPGRLKIVVLHHNLIQPPEFGGYRAIRGGGEILQRFAAAGCSLVLSGHTHVPLVATTREFFPAVEPPITLATCGTSTSGRYRKHGPVVNNAYWIRCAAGGFELEELVWREGRWLTR